MSVHVVFAGKLLRASRPGYPRGKDCPVPEKAVLEWVEQVRESSVASILCLLDDRHLSMYADCAGGTGLLEAYRQAGFVVGHVPVQDHKSPPLSQVEMDQALEWIGSLPKQVLVHCSAGVDRTGAVVERIRTLCVAE
jgi:protein tyrosine/serine phosphatase